MNELENDFALGNSVKLTLTSPVLTKRKPQIEPFVYSTIQAQYSRYLPGTQVSNQVLVSSSLEPGFGLDIKKLGHSPLYIYVLYLVLSIEKGLIIKYTCYQKVARTNSTKFLILDKQLGKKDFSSSIYFGKIISANQIHVQMPFKKTVHCRFLQENYRPAFLSILAYCISLTYQFS